MARTVSPGEGVEKSAEGGKPPPTFKQRARVELDKRGEELATKVKATQGKETLQEIAAKTTEGKVAIAVLEETEANFDRVKSAWDKGDILTAIRESSKSPANPAMPMFIGLNAIADGIEALRKKLLTPPPPPPEKPKPPADVLQIQRTGVQILAVDCPVELSSPCLIPPVSFGYVLLGLAFNIEIPAPGATTADVLLEVLDGAGNVFFSGQAGPTAGIGTWCLNFQNGIGLPDRLVILPSMVVRLDWGSSGVPASGTYTLLPVIYMVEPIPVDTPPHSASS